MPKEKPPKGISLFLTWDLFLIPTVNLRDKHTHRMKLRTGVAFIFLAWKLIFWKERN